MGFVRADYETALIRRYDDDGLTPLLSAADFPNLKTEPIAFTTARGILLRGFLYSYPSSDNDLVVVVHGIGGGHRSYMREIEYLCRSGHCVLAYDAAGCFASEGESIYSLAEGVANLRACLKFVNGNEALCHRPLKLFGHSWGGYAVANVLHDSDTIRAAVIISGFSSVRAIVDASMADCDKAARDRVMARERAVSPKDWNLSAADALLHTNAAVLAVHSRDDRTVEEESSVAALQNTICRPNLKFMTVNGKYHTPHFTKEAVEYMNAFFFGYQKGIESGQLDTFEKKKAYIHTADVMRMTEQDGAVWAKILDILGD